MTAFGVTEHGFTIKPFDLILEASQERARAAFGSDVDLGSTSPLRKILEVVAAEDAELWKRLEDLYYSNFISTASGVSLDLLGEDLGLTRRNLFSGGPVTFTLTNPEPGRRYLLPEGMIVITGAPVQSFHTTEPLTLSAAVPQGTVAARAFARGRDGDIPKHAILGVDPEFRKRYLDLGQAVELTATNPQPFVGGKDTEPDEVYRARLLGLPRNLWTVESVVRAVLDVEGVVDVEVFDPLGGVDVAQSYFNQFNFNERLFGTERRLGEPYFFDVVVAHEIGWPWETVNNVVGVYERVLAAVDRVRPVGIHPNVIQANHIEVGVQATLVVAPGADTQAILAAVKERIATRMGTFKLGGDALFSQVMRAFVEEPGVSDVQQMRLRRCPPAFGRISFGTVPFQTSVVEAPPGENVIMGPREIAVFRLDSDLIDIDVATR
jgi:uncharacterized phage protein gp47/JayE